MSSHSLPYTADTIYLLWKDVTLFFHLTFDMRNLSPAQHHLASPASLVKA